MNRRRGITITEVLIALAVIAGLVVWLCVATFANRRTAAQLKDADQIRHIMQGMIVWCNSSAGEYPLPSRFDSGDTTVPELGRAKNTTANIFSMMIYNGVISPAHCISVSEKNPSIVVDKDFAYNTPVAAVDPKNALWDPAFSADFTNGNTGNVSIAHLQPGGRRTAAWQDTFSPDEAVLANRGPEISSVTISGKPELPASYIIQTAKPTSLASAIHGSPTRWRGNAAFNDGHVAYFTYPGPFVSQATLPGSWKLPYTDATGKLDTIFFDEPDDPKDFNLFLGIFTTAGEEPSDFKGIWD